MGMTPTRPAETAVAPGAHRHGRLRLLGVGSALPGRRRAAGHREGRPRHDRPLRQRQLPALLRLLVRRRHHPGLLAHARARHGRSRLRRARHHAACPTFDRVEDDDGRLPSKFDEVDRDGRRPASTRSRSTNGGILVEMTATPHAAHHRYTYPARRHDGARRARSRPPHRQRHGLDRDARRSTLPRSTVTGSFRSLGGPSGGFGGSMIYFAPKTQQPWSQARRVEQGAAARRRARRRRAPASASTSTSTSRAQPGPVEIQVGLSFVSAAGGRREPRRRDADLRVRRRGRRHGGRVAAGDVGRAGAGRHRRAAGDDAGAPSTTSSSCPRSRATWTAATSASTARSRRRSGCHYCSELSLWDTYRTLAPLHRPRGSRPRARHGAVARRDGEGRRLLPQVAHRRRRGRHDDRRERRGRRRRRLREGHPQLRRRGRVPDPCAPRRWTRPIRRAVAAAAIRWCRTCSSATSRRSLRRHLSSSCRSPSSTARTTPRSSQFAAALGHTRRRDDAARPACTAGRSSTTRRPACSGRRTPTAPGRARTATAPRRERATSTRPTRRRALWGPWYDVAGLETRDSAARRPSSPSSRPSSSRGRPTTTASTGPSRCRPGSRRPASTTGAATSRTSTRRTSSPSPAGPTSRRSGCRGSRARCSPPAPTAFRATTTRGRCSAWLVFSMLGFYAVPGTDQYVVGAPAFPQGDARGAGRQLHHRGAGRLGRRTCTCRA